MVEPGFRRAKRQRLAVEPGAAGHGGSEHFVAEGRVGHPQDGFSSAEAPPRRRSRGGRRENWSSRRWGRSTTGPRSPARAATLFGFSISAEDGEVHRFGAGVAKGSAGRRGRRRKGRTISLCSRTTWRERGMISWAATARTAASTWGEGGGSWRFPPLDRAADGRRLVLLASPPGDLAQGFEQFGWGLAAGVRVGSPGIKDAPVLLELEVGVEAEKSGADGAVA